MNNSPFSVAVQAEGVTKLCPPLCERVLAQSLLLSPRFQGECGRERPPGVPSTCLDRIGVPGGPALPHVSRKKYEIPTVIRPAISRYSAVTKFGHTRKRTISWSGMSRGVPFDVLPLAVVQKFRCCQASVIHAPHSAPVGVGWTIVHKARLG